MHQTATAQLRDLALCYCTPVLFLDISTYFSRLNDFNLIFCQFWSILFPPPLSQRPLSPHPPCTLHKAWKMFMQCMMLANIWLLNMQKPWWILYLSVHRPALKGTVSRKKCSSWDRGKVGKVPRMCHNRILYFYDVSLICDEYLKILHEISAHYKNLSQK